MSLLALTTVLSLMVPTIAAAASSPSPGNSSSRADDAKQLRRSRKLIEWWASADRAGNRFVQKQLRRVAKSDKVEPFDVDSYTEINGMSSKASRSIALHREGEGNYRITAISSTPRSTSKRSKSATGGPLVTEDRFVAGKRLPRLLDGAVDPAQVHQHDLITYTKSSDKPDEISVRVERGTSHVLSTTIHR